MLLGIWLLFVGGRCSLGNKMNKSCWCLCKSFLVSFLPPSSCWLGWGWPHFWEVDGKGGKRGNCPSRSPRIRSRGGLRLSRTAVPLAVWSGLSAPAAPRPWGSEPSHRKVVSRATWNFLECGNSSSCAGGAGSPLQCWRLPIRRGSCGEGSTCFGTWRGFGSAVTHGFWRDRGFLFCVLKLYLLYLLSWSFLKIQK